MFCGKRKVSELKRRRRRKNTHKNIKFQVLRGTEKFDRFSTFSVLESYAAASPLFVLMRRRLPRAQKRPASGGKSTHISRMRAIINQDGFEIDSQMVNVCNFLCPTKSEWCQATISQPKPWGMEIVCWLNNLRRQRQGKQKSQAKPNTGFAVAKNSV